MTVLSGILFLTFIVTIIVGFVKKNRILKLVSLGVFIIFCTIIIWTGGKFLNKSIHKISKILEPRSGNEIYDELLGKREHNCVKILNSQDQVIPKIDYAIWLEFETCSEEFDRIIKGHDFSENEIIITPKNKDWLIPLANTDNLKWFNPKSLGDTITVYEYASENNKNIQTIWTNRFKAKVFLRDISD